jgi:hypothetical protein
MVPPGMSRGERSKEIWARLAHPSKSDRIMNHDQRTGPITSQHLYAETALREVHPDIARILTTTLGLEQSPVERAKQLTQEREDAFKDRWNRGLDGMCEGGEKDL